MNRRLSSRRRSSLAGITCFLLAASLWAAAARFEVVLERPVLRMGETTVATLNFIDGTPQGDIALPQVNQLELRQLSGVSSKLSFVNGKRSMVRSVNLQVRPLAVGSFTIPSMSIRMDGKMVASKPVVLNVRRPLPPPALQKLTQQGYLADLVLPKTNVYVGEPFVFYIRAIYRDASVAASDIENEGFTFTDGKAEHVIKQYGNTRYNEVLAPKIALPLKIGRLKIGPTEVQMNIVLRRDVFRRPVQSRPVKEQLPAKEINVLPVPTEGRPASFSGAVGKYTMNVTASPTNLTAGDPITLNIEFVGVGALENVQLPSFEDWKDFKAYPPNSNLEYANRQVSSGTRKFEQVVVPERAGIAEIPAIEFSFFDPEARAFRTLKQPPIPLTVTPAASVSAAPVIMVTQTNQAAAGPQIATELVHIKQHLGRVRAVGSTGNGVWFMPAVTFLAWFLLRLRRRGIEKLENDPRLRRRLETDRLVADELVRLKSLADAGEGTEFFKLLVTLLQERLGERLDLPASAITESVVEDKLKPAGVDEELVARLENLFDSCNQAHYAPDMAKAELQKLAADAEIALGALTEVKL